MFFKSLRRKFELPPVLSSPATGWRPPAAKKPWEKRLAKAIPTLFLRPEVSLTDVAAIKQATDRTKQHLGASDVSMTLFHAHVQGSLWSLRIYAPGGKPAQVLDAAGDATVSAIFHIMIGEMGGDHTLTFDLIRNYLMKMHDSALKLQPSETLY